MSTTQENLMAAFAGESQARNRYTYFARRAAEEGYDQIAEIFEETADNECEHALRFFKFFNGGELEITDLSSLPEDLGKRMMDIWYDLINERSEEAHLVRMADRIEMMFQAYEYEQAGWRGLDDFFENIEGISLSTLRQEN